MYFVWIAKAADLQLALRYLNKKRGEQWLKKRPKVLVRVARVTGLF
jgi:hypothetical protein